MQRSLFSTVRTCTRRNILTRSASGYATTATTTTTAAPTPAETPFEPTPLTPEQEATFAKTFGEIPEDVILGDAFASLGITLKRPLHMPLSSLIPRQPGEPRAWTKVAALAPSVFSHPIRRDILHACVIHHLDGLRQGTASTKTRAEVGYSGRKVRPQKGSGRARLGDRGSPVIRGGGVAFGPKPRDFATKLPRKVRDMGMRVALSAKVKDRSLKVVESLDWPGVKTNELFKRVRSLGWGKTLFVVGAGDIPNGLERSSGNIQDVECRTAEELTVYDVLKWKTIVLDSSAVDWFEARLGKEDLFDLIPGTVDQGAVEASA